MSQRGGNAECAGACFIEPMLCLAVEKLPEGPAWQYEVKLDSYRAIGIRTKAGVELWSRNKRDFSRRFQNVARALEALPVETVVDGEIVAVNGDGQPKATIKNNDGFSEREKLDLFVDVESIKDQLAKEHPNKNVIGHLWSGIEKLATTAGLI